LTSDRVSGHDLSLALEMFQRLDPNGSGLLRSPQLEAFRRPDSKALTLSELLESPQLHSQLEVHLVIFFPFFSNFLHVLLYTGSIPRPFL
jgi:hypothetical protein